MGMILMTGNGIYFKGCQSVRNDLECKDCFRVVKMKLLHYVYSGRFLMLNIVRLIVTIPSPLGVQICNTSNERAKIQCCFGASPFQAIFS